MKHAIVNVSASDLLTQRSCVVVTLVTGIGLSQIHSTKLAPLTIKPRLYCNVADMAASSVGAKAHDYRQADVPSPPFQNLHTILVSTLERASWMLPGAERDARLFAGKLYEAFLRMMSANDGFWVTMRKRKVSEFKL